jgi:hypothetical protein
MSAGAAKLQMTLLLCAVILTVAPTIQHAELERVAVTALHRILVLSVYAEMATSAILLSTTLLYARTTMGVSLPRRCLLYKRPACL